MTQDEMIGRHNRFNGRVFEQALGVGYGQGSLAYCSPWGHKESDMIVQLNWTELMLHYNIFVFETQIVPNFANRITFQSGHEFFDMFTSFLENFLIFWIRYSRFNWNFPASECTVLEFDIKQSVYGMAKSPPRIPYTTSSSRSVTHFVLLLFYVFQKVDSCGTLSGEPGYFHSVQCTYSSLLYVNLKMNKASQTEKLFYEEWSKISDKIRKK